MRPTSRRDPWRISVSGRPCRLSYEPRASCPAGWPFSKQQHRVPVAVEAVALFDRLAVEAQDALAAREGADQHEQRAARQVEVGEQRVDGAEPRAGEEEEARLARAGVERARVAGAGLQDSRR